MWNSQGNSHGVSSHLSNAIFQNTYILKTIDMKNIVVISIFIVPEGPVSLNINTDKNRQIYALKMLFYAGIIESIKEKQNSC